MRDPICDAVMEKIAAEQLMAGMEWLEISQRVLIFASVGLGMPVSVLAAEMEISEDQAWTEIREGLAALQANDALHQLLAGASRVGRLEDFHSHIQRLRLESWFCRLCHRFQVQKGRGRPRVTCSDQCRRELYEVRKQRRA